jgi:cell wall-associated NlpC family hydrolase
MTFLNKAILVITTFSAQCALFACAATPSDVSLDVTPVDTGWSTNVIGIEEMHLSATYWADKATRPDDILHNQDAIAKMLRFAYDHDPNIVNLAAYPTQIASSEVATLIRSISKPYSRDLFYRDGGKVSAGDYDRYDKNLNLDALVDDVSIRFAMVLQRADMRTWPTADVVHKNKQTIDLDRFQENGLFPADAVVVLHESADGEWFFVQSYNYAAWVGSDMIALGDRQSVLDYASSERFLVITGSKVTTNFNPRAADVSELQLDMGVRLPLVAADKLGGNVDGQNPYASYAVRLPVRGENGDLAFHTALIARSQDVHRGFLPYTRRNIVGQAFKFLGERYGWGHSYNARDCTGLVSEVYKTFGVLLPRNSGQQGHSPIGDTHDFKADASAEEKMDVLASANVGDLLYSTGHVMMYLGSEDGQPYVIHDLSGSGWQDKDGNFQEGVLNGVSVTPLTPIHSSPEATYFEEMYAIKKIR